jgi:hypothetical protein
MDQAEKEALIDGLTDDQIMELGPLTTSPWSYQELNKETHRDEDGFAIDPMGNLQNFSQLQAECWKKFVLSPQINSHVRDYQGSLTGSGFCMGSDVQEIQDAMTEISEDPRNEFHKRLPQYVARAEIEGELFLPLTVHVDGFVEIDFMEPQSLKGGGDSNSGIIFHPKKQTMPLMYRFEQKSSKGASEIIHVPSIYLAMYPQMYKLISGNPGITQKSLRLSLGIGRKYSKLGGFKSFITSWDRGFLTKRNVSHIRTTIMWVNHYENLKKWEIDHKKSSGSYLWVVQMEDAKAYRTWLKLTDEQKKSTGLFAKKVPGGTLVLPPGVSLKCENPNLASISDQDTDIMQMVVSGLNAPNDMVTGATKGSTFGGIKATRQPQSDRTNDQIAYFERFLRFDFWRWIFFLRGSMIKFPETYSVKEAVEFKNKEPVFKTVKKKHFQLVDFEFPVSEISDSEATARALLGVKHGSVAESLGIPKADIAKKMGFGGYKKKRLRFATEEKTLPKTPLAILVEAAQSSSPEGEPGVPNNNTPAKKDDSKEN